MSEKPKTPKEKQVAQLVAAAQVDERRMSGVHNDEPQAGSNLPGGGS